MEMKELVSTTKDTVPPNKIKLIKNTKGYNWELTVSGDDIEEMENQIESLDQWARNHYQDG
jgi:hypothetical protein